MATTDQLIQNSRLLQEARYFRTVGTRQRVAAANPAQIASYKQRDPLTGQLLATVRGLSGSQIRNQYISNQSIGRGQVLPASSGSGANGFADIKPV